MMNCFLPQTTPDQIIGNPLSGKSFFEPHQYKVALDRCETGYKSCAVHSEIFDEYAHLHESHQKALKKWRESSEKKIHQSGDFGNNKKSWLETVRAMEMTGEWHGELAKKIREDVVQKTNAYRSQEYGRSLVHSKKRGDFEKSFSKVHKPWTDLLEKLNEALAKYKESKAVYDAAIRQAQYYTDDVGADPEKKDEMKNSVEKREKKLKKHRDQYESCLRDVKAQKDQYKASMIKILDETHKFEGDRLDHYLKTFQTIQQYIIMSKDPHAKEISDALEAAIKAHDTKSDLQQWNKNYGSETTYPWGIFEELKD